MKKVVVGMSGGVDSAVTAYILKNLGYEVVGVTLKTWVAQGEVSRCCELDDARAVADMLSIPFYTVNCAGEFSREVVGPFVGDYMNGLTPNPCVVCNRSVKWAKMLEFADSVGARFVATGHYASVVRKENGRFTVKTSAHAEKDQTYMLYRLTQPQLERTIMPLGELSKDEVRKIADSARLPVAKKPDSQEICFITEGTYADYIEQNCPDYEPKAGNFTDEDGNILGVHKGLIHYTVGQRKGLGSAFGRPVYVKRSDPVTNSVILAEDDALYTSQITVRSLNFMGIGGIEDGGKIRARVRIRYHHKGENAVIERIGEDLVKVTFDTPVRAATPGQSAVFYDDEGCVTGGGIIA